MSVCGRALPRRPGAAGGPLGPTLGLSFRAVDGVAADPGHGLGGRRMSAVATDASVGSLMEVRDLAVHFRARGGVARAVDGVSLEWRPGEILGVVGESGCGKSTLARAMLGLIEPAAGEVGFH